MEEHQCCECVIDGYMLIRKGNVEVDGAWYCWAHDPGRAARVRNENEERRQTEQLKTYRRLAEQDVCKGVSTEELEKLGTSGLRYMIDNQKAILERFK